MATEFDAAARKQIRKLMRMLETTRELAQHASLTGSLRGGEHQCIRQYNSALNWFQQQDIVPRGLFEPIPEVPNEEGESGKSRAGYGTVGVACALLASYVEGELEDPEEEEELVRLAKENLKAGIIGRDLGNIGQLIREAMPDFLKDNVEAKDGFEKALGFLKYGLLKDKVEAKVREAERAVRDIEREVREAERASRQGGFVGDEARREREESTEEREHDAEEAQTQLDELQGGLDEISGQMDELAARLERGELSSDEVKRLAEQMRRLGERQA